MKTFWIFNPAGTTIFFGKFETRKDCLREHFKGNTINWKGLPKLWWRCKEIKNPCACHGSTDLYCGKCAFKNVKPYTIWQKE